MKFNRAWMILFGLPGLAVGQAPSGANQAQPLREQSGLQQGATQREQAGVPSPATTVTPVDQTKAVIRVPIPPEELGITWGSFQWYPDLNVGLSYDTNLFATRSDTVEEWMWSVSPSIVGRSESDRRELNIRIGASANRYLENFRQNTDDVWLDFQGTYHLSERTDMYGGIGWSRNHEDRGSPDLRFGIEPTVYTDTSAHVGIFHNFGSSYLRFGVAGTHLDFDNVETSTPVVMLINDTRDRNVYSVGGRLGYRSTPTVDVFVQGLLERRDYANATDLAGDARSSEGYRLDAGVAFNVDRRLVGEAYAGVLRQRYIDGSFDAIQALDLGVDVRWHTSPWTTYWLGLERTLDETVVAGSPGYLSTSASARVEHDLSDRTVVNGGVTLTSNRFQQIERKDHQTAWNFGVRHYLSDSVYLGADYRYLHRTSDVVDANYDRGLFMLTLGSDFGARRRNRYFAYEDRSDMALPQVAFDFSGLYVGVQVGSGLLGTVATGLRDEQAGNTDRGELGHLGANAGLFAGFGKQLDRWYFGVELAAQVGGNHLSHDHPSLTEPLIYTINEESGLAASLKVGRVLGSSSMLYGRLGWARTTFNNTMINVDGAFQTSQTQHGRQIGIGAETQLTSDLFWRFDYTVTRYDDYHLVTSSYDELYRNTSSTIFLGLGWRLGGKGESPTMALEPGYLSGFYGGVQFGHGALSSGLTASDHYHDSGSDTLKADFGAAGTTAGAYVGFGRTWGRWYLGAEVDAEGARNQWSHDRVTGGAGGRDFSVEKKWSYGGSLRLGYVLPNGALIYGRLGSVKSLFTTRYARGNSGTLDRDDTLVGHRWGLGVELPASRATFWRLDYSTTAYDDLPAFSSLGSHPDVLSLITREGVFRIAFGVRF